VTELANSRELIGRAQAGDVAAFEKLIDAQIPRLRRFARSFAHSDSNADELAQDALVKVFHSLSSYRFESSFSTWLYQIVKNCFMDSRRSEASRERVAQAAGEASAVDRVARERSGAPDELLLAAEERARLWAAIGELPVAFRNVVVLCDVEGFSLAEVSEIEKVPEGTVKSRLHRGRDRLASLFKEDERRGNPSAAANVLPSESQDTP
jgi:RNA polymerase sigma-70 factor (ECF subfamily)